MVHPLLLFFFSFSFSLLLFNCIQKGALVLRCFAWKQRCQTGSQPTYKKLEQLKINSLSVSIWPIYIVLGAVAPIGSRHLVHFQNTLVSPRPDFKTHLKIIGLPLKFTWKAQICPKRYLFWVCSPQMKMRVHHWSNIQ